MYVCECVRVFVSVGNKRSVACSRFNWTETAHDDADDDGVLDLNLLFFFPIVFARRLETSNLK